jgi:hypothetical protein
MVPHLVHRFNCPPQAQFATSFLLFFGSKMMIPYHLGSVARFFSSYRAPPCLPIYSPGGNRPEGQRRREFF